jgi:epoxyqueuosine reductase QueG
MTTLNSEIKARLIEAGASLVGFADTSDLSADVTGSMRSAISIAVALDASIISEIADGPTERYYQEYNRVNTFLADLCKLAVEYLESRGNKAVAIKPTVEGKDLDYETLMTSIPHKTVARLAGLGWIGKSALLVTKEYGPAVRLATVLTDAELEAAKPLNASSCGDCVKCVENCPAKAISGRNWELGLEREMIYDAFACCDTATRLSKKAGISSVICGICINVCPWAQKYISRELTS